ncbi:MAG: TonB-dependent receptor [Chlorobiaceae bacterium]|nr:TonB-dependent receptor [Chlorobiaceae bacterium]
MNKKVCLLVLAGLLCGKGLLAEETTKSFTGSELVVTSSRVEEEKKKVTSSITVIGREEIEHSSARDLGELLAQKSLGYIHIYPGSLTSVGIRGFRTESHGNDLKGKVLLLLNGRRAGTGNLAEIMTDNVERIEIIRGPAAVQYGSAAIGGVVNVITRKGEGRPSFYVEHSQGSSDFHETSGGFSGSYGKLDFSGSYSVADGGDYRTAEGTAYHNTGYDDKVRGNLNVGYEFLPGHRLNVIYSSFDVDRQGSPYYLLENDLTSYNKLTNESVDVIYNGKLTDGKFRWMARYFNGEDHYRYPSTGFDQKVDQQGAQGQLTYTDRGISVTGGVDWLDYRQYSSSSPKDSEYKNPAGFLLVKAALLDEALILSAGLRYDDYDVSIYNNEGESRSTDRLTKSFGIAYNIDDSIKLRANFAEGFRMPTADEFAADYIADWGSYGQYAYTGNPDLEPESSRTYEAGVDISHGALKGALTCFTTDFKDKIITIYDFSAYPVTTVTYDNVGDAKVSGFEGELSYSFSVSPGGYNIFVDPFLGGTYLTEYKDKELDKKLQYIPEWNLATGVRFRDRHGLSGSLSLSLFGPTEVKDFRSNADVTKGSFVLADMTLAKRIVFDRDNDRAVTVKGAVNNLFDRNYEYVTGYPMPGRSFIVGVRVDI